MISNRSIASLLCMKTVLTETLVSDRIGIRQQANWGDRSRRLLRLGFSTRSLGCLASYGNGWALKSLER
jgi:hypothetical protein